MKQLIRKLAVLVMLAVCLVAPQSMNAKTVYFDAGSHSGNVYVYIVDGDNASDGWNNTANCKLCTKVFDNVWAYDVANATKVIFTWHEYSTDNNKLTKDCNVQDGYIYKNDKVDQSGEEYIVGLLGDGLADANGWSINDNDLVKLKPSSNFYEFEGTLKTKSGSGNKNFRIYNKYRGKEYEPSAYLQVLPENTVSFSNTGANQCWWINEGEYTIKVNLKDNKFVVSKKYKNVYLRGDEFGGWGDNTPFATTDYITYTITKDFAAGKEFKIYDENSKSYYRISDTNPSNGTFDGDGTTSGNMKFATDQKNVTITFNKDTKKITFSGIASSTVEYTYWLRFNNDRAIDVEIFENTPLVLTSLGGNTFTVVVKDKATKEQKYVYGKNVTINGSATVSPLTLNGGQITIPQREGNYTFTLTLDDKKMPTSIKVDVPENGEVITGQFDYYVKVYNGNNHQEYKFENGVAKVDCASKKGWSFGIMVTEKGKTEEKFWYASDDSNNKMVAGTGSTTFGLYKTSNNMTLPSLKTGDFTFTLTLDGDMPKSLVVACPQIEEPNIKARIAGSFVTVEKEWGGYPEFMSWNPVVGAFEYTTTSDGVFMVSMDQNDFWNGRYEEIDIPSERPNSSNLKKGNKGDLKISEPGVIYFIPDDNKIWFERLAVDNSSFEGKVFLLGDLLNDNHESPAWEMKKQADGTYFIDKFAMRNCEGSIATYKDGKRTVVTPANSGKPTYGDGFQPGWYYSATYNPSNNTLVFKPMTGENYSDMQDVLPYIGILGEKFTQNTSDGKGYTTYHSSKTMGNTNKGWQEAYIEYEDGKPLFDSYGNAYYNTVWPPRSNILMKSDLGKGVDPLSVSTKDLTMVLDSRGAKTSAEWKTLLTGSDYKNLVLDTDKTYYRYVADDMWMLGQFKFWTGWAGKKDARDGGVAEWENHWYWGSGENGEGKEKDLLTYTTTKAEKDGNYRTKDNKRQYYKTLELFIPLKSDGSLDRANVKIYLTEALGGAKIDSYLETNNTKEQYHHVGFNPTLDETDGKFPNGSYVTGYTITRHRYVPDEENPNNYPFVDRKNVETSKENAIVKNGKNTETLKLESAKAFNDLFTKDFNTNFVDDGEYDPGLYIYHMVVEFDGTSGKMSADVWSPWVQILDDNYTVNADVYQLIELPAESYSEYNYITYSTVNDPQLVKVEGEAVTAMAPYSGNDYTTILDKTGKWTNKTLFVTEEPSLFVQTQGLSKTISDFSIKNKENSVVDFLENGKINNKYVGVCDNSKILESIDFSVNFEGAIITAGANDTEVVNPAVAKPKKVTYTPTFPLPYFGTPQVTVKYDRESEGNDRGREIIEDFTATHDLLDEAKTKTTAAAEISANVPVVMPNIVADIKSDVYRKLIMAINGNDVTAKADATTYGLNYRYQSPYNWVEQNAKNNWVAKENTWTMDASYATGINAYVASNAKNSVSASVTPEFNVPTCGERKYSFGMEYNTENEEWYNRLYVKKYTASGTDILGGEKFFQNENALHMVHIIGDNDDENKYISDLMYHETGNNSDKTHLVAEQHINKTEMTLALDAYHRGDASAMTALMGKGKAWATGKTIEFGYAHFFKANEVGDSQSAYEGFTGPFPYLRYDLVTTAAQNAPMRENGKNWTETLDTNDNAFILVPYLTQTTVAADDIATGIDDVFGEDTLNVVAGKGFIDMMGNEGRIYATDGRQVYIGAERAELPQGVYMVVLANKTVKVMVK